MTNSNNDEGVRARITRRVLEATSEADLKLIRQELKEAGEKQGSIDAVVSELRKKGHLKFDGAAGSFYPVKIGKSEIIPPEQALAHIRLQDGDYKLGFVDGMGVLIMAARYNQLLAASQAEVLANQLRIMEESRKGSADIAQETAERTIGSVLPQILEAVKQAAVASSPNPFATMMSQAMQPLLQQTMGNLMRAFTPQPGQPQPGQPDTQPQPGQQPQSQVQPQPGVQMPGQQVSEDEIEGEFSE